MQRVFTQLTSRFLVQQIHFQNVRMRPYHFKLNFLSSGKKETEFNGATLYAPENEHKEKQRGNSAHHGNTKEEECWITASRVRGTLHEQRMERHHTSWNQRGPALCSRVSTQNVFEMENPMDLQNPQETR
ncbi:hypothetical protein D4764_02G0010930 [Takifugu flavidus]|uniref:Uncharacterized protein n=1 Tax=Takifugu flavidus TaxID=433684 RepID=A0A5C6NKB2_9TELE|nr:hypothetical protein D4764_02G0010930 [Takifugu flavidus]